MILLRGGKRYMLYITIYVVKSQGGETSSKGGGGGGECPLQPPPKCKPEYRHYNPLGRIGLRSNATTQAGGYL